MSTLLREIVGTFLRDVTEREFDAPLLALLSSRGFHDVHFIHGAFEFGKDVVAKKTDSQTGQVRQYLLQSKAGDLGLAEWRAVRPQLDECGYNTAGHPGCDADLPRVVVLVTTGRLKGAAATDAGEYRKSFQARHKADFEVWDHSDLTSWICEDLSIGVAGSGELGGLAEMVGHIEKGTLNEPRIEFYTRKWLGGTVSERAALIEGPLLAHLLFQKGRYDLAFCVALQLVRSTALVEGGAPAHIDAAKRLVVAIAREIRLAVAPVANDPTAFVRALRGPLPIIAYPVACCRSAEAMALASLLTEERGNEAETADFCEVLRVLAGQPGTARPVSDLFGASVVAVVVALNRYASAEAQKFLRSVARWVLSCHDSALSNIGLAAHHASEMEVATRLLGGPLESTTLPYRRESYLVTVVSDLALHLADHELHEAFVANVKAMNLVGESTSADEEIALWRRGGDHVWPVPAASLEQVAGDCAKPKGPVRGDPVLSLLLTCAVRSRHYPATW